MSATPASPNLLEGNIEEVDIDRTASLNLLESKLNERTKEDSTAEEWMAEESDIKENKSNTNKHLEDAGLGIIEEFDNGDHASPNLLESELNEQVYSNSKEKGTIEVSNGIDTQTKKGDTKGMKTVFPIEETISSSGRPVSPIGDCCPCDLDLLRRCSYTSLTLSACSECPAYFIICSEGPRSVSVPPGRLISLVAIVLGELASHKDLLITGAVKILGHHSPGLQKQLAMERQKRKIGIPLPYPAVRPMYGKYLMVTVVNNSNNTQVYLRGMQLGQVQLMRGLLPVLELPEDPLPMKLSSVMGVTAKKMAIRPFREHTDLTLITSLPPGIHVRLVLSMANLPNLRFSLGGSLDEVTVVQLGGKVDIGVINTSSTRLVLDANATIAWGTAIHPQDWIKDRLALGRLS